MGETGDFVFESNKGFASDLAPFVGDPDGRAEPDEDAARKVVNHLQVDTSEVLRFLRHFILRSEPLPSRHYIDAVAERDLAVVMEQLGMDPAFARRCFAAMTSRIAAMSTQRPPDPAQRVTRLIGFMRDIENRSGHDLDACLLTMAELRNIVTADSTRAASRRPVSPRDAANIHPRAAYEVEALPLAVAVLDYAPVLADIGLDHFAGREWLVAAIEDVVSADSVARMPRTGRYVLVGAGAGLGKTTLAGWLSRRWGCACHFTGVSGGRDARVALQSLAAQLIIRYGLEEEFAAGGIRPAGLEIPHGSPGFWLLQQSAPENKAGKSASLWTAWMRPKATESRWTFPRYCRKASASWPLTGTGQRRIGCPAGNTSPPSRSWHPTRPTAGTSGGS